MIPLILRIVLIVASVLVAIYTIKKIRKAQLNIDDSIFWIGFSVMLIIISVFPQIPVYLSKLLDIASPVNFVFLFVIFLIVVKLFKLAIEISVVKHRLNSLVQKIALINHEVEENSSVRLGAEKKADNDLG